MNVLMNDGTEFKSPSAIRDGVKGGARKGEPMDDLISRQQAIDAIMGEYPDVHYPDWYASKIRALPSAQPYTAEELQTMQRLESAQVEKAYELGRESAQSELDSEALIRTIETGITATNSNDIYSIGMRNGMRWCKSLIDGVEPKFEGYAMSVDDWKELSSIQTEPYRGGVK